MTSTLINNIFTSAMCLLLCNSAFSQSTYKNSEETNPLLKEGAFSGKPNTLRQVSTHLVQVISEVDKSPLSFATVTNLTDPQIVSCSSQGIAKLTITEGDSLSISHVGFITKKVVCTGEEIQVVSLIQHKKLLEAVEVKNCKAVKKYQHSNFDEKSKIKARNLGPNPGLHFTKGPYNPKAAVHISQPKSRSYLYDFSFWIQKHNLAPVSSITTPLLITFHEVSPITQLPGEPLSTSAILYYPKKSGKQTLQVDSLRIRIPPEGIYASFQYVMNEEFEWKYASKWKDHAYDTLSRDTVITMYGGILVCTRSTGFDLAFYNGIKNKWFSTGTDPERRKKQHLVIKYAATINYCDVD